MLQVLFMTAWFYASGIQNAQQTGFNYFDSAAFTTKEACEKYRKALPTYDGIATSKPCQSRRISVIYVPQPDARTTG